MQNFFLMAMPNTLQQLIGKTLDDVRIHSFFFAEIVHKLLEIVVEVFEDQNQFSIGVDDFAKGDDVDMVELFQNGNLSDGGGRDALFF